MGTQDFEIGIVGGGIVGCSLAYYLSKKGFSALLLDKDSVGSGSSGAATGIISDPMFVEEETSYSDMKPFVRLNRAGFDLYPEFVEQIENETGEDIYFRQDGGYYLAFNENELRDCKSYFKEMEKFDRPVNWVEPEEANSTFDGLNNRLLGGFHYHRECHVEPRELMNTLASACRKNDVTIEEDTPVKEVASGDHYGHVLKTNQRDYHVKKAVLTTGAWTRLMTEDYDHSVPVSPRKGQAIELEALQVKELPLLQLGDWHLVPRRGNRAVFGATLETESNFKNEPTKTARQTLLEQVQEAIDGIGTENIEDHWSGLRPYAHRKGGPFIGEIPDHSELYVCAGHYRNGIAQGPVTAKLLADYMAGEDMLFKLDDYKLKQRL